MRILQSFKLPSLILGSALFAGLGGFSTLAITAQPYTTSYLIDLNNNTARELRGLDADEIIARGINDAGQVAGYSDTFGGRHAFITGPNGVGMRYLGTLPGTLPEDATSAYDINDAGQVVGMYGWSGEGSLAFITGPNGVGMRSLGPAG
jgi:probable HAF family extracellular repeat protein